ncbi:MAG: hypothetical protein ACKVOK_13945 [Flavobacteriales bacterium]
MVKKILIAAVILAAIAAIAFMYIKLTRGNETYTASIEGIPASSAFILKADPGNYNQEEMNLLIALSLSENNIGEESFNPLKHWPAILEELINLQSYQPSWKTLLENSDIVFASGQQFRSDTWIMSIGLKSETSAGAVEEMMFAWKPEKGFAKREFKGGQIVSNEKIHYSIQHNCLLVSPSVAAIEDAIIQHGKENRLFGKPEFASAWQVMSTDNFLNVACSSGELSWMQLNPLNRDGAWLLSGYLIDNDAMSNSLQLTGSGVAPQVQDYLPANTTLLDAYSFVDFETGWAAQETFFSHNNPTGNKFWGQAWKDYGDSCQCDLNEIMLSWRSGEWGTAIISNADSTTSEILYFGINDSTDVLSMMQPLIKKKLENGAGELRYPTLFDRNKPQSVLVETNYIQQKGPFVFVASTPSDLVKAMDKNSTLSALPAFTKTFKSLDKKSSRYLYQSGQLFSPLAPSLLHILNGLEGFSASSEPFKENKFLIQVALPIDAGKFAKQVEESQPTAETESQSGNIADALRGPWEVVNHTTKGTEKIYQNKNKELCLFGEDGKLLWTHPLDAEIVGSVSQIDALKNGKLQYAFAAGKNVHVIDRTGKSLQSFPVLLGAQASSALYVFDYDNTRSYRMIVGSEDGALHNHNAQGKMNEGWKYSGTAPIALVKHVKVSGEDVLIAVTHAGSIKVLKRNGEIKQETASALANWDKKDVEIRALGALKDLKITYKTTSGESATIGL